MAEGGPNYWQSLVAPAEVPRPRRSELKYYYLFFRDENGGIWDRIWGQIYELTRRGELGYYCGYSPDQNVIAVHSANPFNMQQMEIIKDQLVQLGIQGIKIRTKVADRDLVSDEDIIADALKRMDIND